MKNRYFTVAQFAQRLMYISTLTNPEEIYIAQGISIENYLTPAVPTMDCKDATEQEDPAVNKMTKK